MTGIVERLEACHCGAAAEMLTLGGIGPDVHRCACTGLMCKASTAWFADQSEARSAWNARASAATITAMSAALEAVDRQLQSAESVISNAIILARMDGDNAKLIAAEVQQREIKTLADRVRAALALVQP